MRVSTIGLISTNYDNTSFEALTSERTLPTLMFGGKYRLIDFAISNMVNAGIRSVGVIAPYNFRSLSDHLGPGKPWGLARKAGGLFMLPGGMYTSRERGARFMIRNLVQNRIFLEKEDADFVLLSDGSTVMNADFAEFIDFHAKSGCDLTLFTKDVPGREDGTYAVCDNGRVKAIVGPDEGSDNRILAMIVNRKFLISLIDTFSAMDFADILSIIADRIANIKVGCFKYAGYVGIIEDLNDYMACSRDLLDADIRAELFDSDRKIFTKPQDRTPTIYRSGASVRNSLVAAGCVIEGTVENCIISRNTYIGKGAVVRDAVLMQKCRVEDGASIKNMICDKGVVIGKNVRLEGGDEKPLVLGKGTRV